MLMSSSEPTPSSLQKSASRSSSLLSTWGSSLSGDDMSRWCSRSSAAVQGSLSTTANSQRTRKHSCLPICQESHPASALQVKGAWAAPPRSTQLPSVPDSSSEAAKHKGLGEMVHAFPRSGCFADAAVSCCLWTQDSNSSADGHMYNLPWLDLQGSASHEPACCYTVLLLSAWRQPGVAAQHPHIHIQVQVIPEAAASCHAPRGQ